MYVTLLGMVTEVRLEQLEKARFAMDVTLLGMVTEVRLEQPEKAKLPMYVTLLGMVTEVRLEHFSKAWSPMEVTLRVLFIYVTSSGMTIIPEYLVFLVTCNSFPSL